jgi:hypothetical protein
MNRVCVAAWMLVLMLETGCPVGGGAGVLHQAMLKDLAMRLAGDSCQPGDVWDECGSKYYEDCMASCQEEMRRKARK